MFSHRVVKDSSRLPLFQASDTFTRRIRATSLRIYFLLRHRKNKQNSKIWLTTHKFIWKSSDGCFHVRATTSSSILPPGDHKVTWCDRKVVREREKSSFHCAPIWMRFVSRQLAANEFLQHFCANECQGVVSSGGEQVWKLMKSQRCPDLSSTL